MATRWTPVCRPLVSHHKHLSESIMCIVLCRYDPIAAWPDRNRQDRPANSFLMLRRYWRRRPLGGWGLYRRAHTRFEIYSAVAWELVSVAALVM